MASTTTALPQPARSKARRIRETRFADVEVFRPAGGKFSPLPWIYRRVLWLFAPREWQILTYFMMRVSQEGVLWQSDKEIAFDLGIGFRKLAPHMKALRERGFILVVEELGQRYICLPEPAGVLRRLVESGEISGDRLLALNEDLEVMRSSQFEGPEAPKISSSEKEEMLSQG
jgi:hypothetical protein